MHYLKVTKSVLCQYRGRLWCQFSVSRLLQRAVEVDLTIPPPDHLSEEIKALSNAIASMHTDARKTRRDFLLHQANISEELQQKQQACIIWQILKTEEHMEAYKILKSLKWESKANQLYFKSPGSRFQYLGTPGITMTQTIMTWKIQRKQLTGGQWFTQTRFNSYCNCAIKDIVDRPQKNSLLSLFHHFQQN